MAWRHYTSIELIELLQVSDEVFHRIIKKQIKKISRMKAHGIDNPDILLNEQYVIALADPRKHNFFFETEINIFAYI